MKFSIPKEELAAIDEWLDGLKSAIIAEQKKNLPPDILAILLPDEIYYGAIGGSLSYSFTPTSLGVIIEIKENVTGQTLNATEAAGWKNFG